MRETIRDAGAYLAYDIERRQQPEHPVSLVGRYRRNFVERSIGFSVEQSSFTTSVIILASYHS